MMPEVYKAAFVRVSGYFVHALRIKSYPASGVPANDNSHNLNI